MTAEPKTKLTNQSIDDCPGSIENKQQRQDSKTLVTIMHKIMKCKPAIWETSIVGFGQYHYQYKSGREGDWPLTGFSARKQFLSIYIMPSFSDYGDLLQNLGKYKLDKSCLNVKSLDDINIDVSQKLIKHSVEHRETSQ